VKAAPPRHRLLRTTALGILTLALAIGWMGREIAFARMSADPVKSGTVNLDAVKMSVENYEGKPVGQVGIYFAGDTPASKKFVTGRFIIDPGKTPHAPHTHVEEEVMVVESGNGEIFCDGKTTKVGPGSVMFTAPNASHGIVNTGDAPLVFYFIKWTGDGSK
jgi:mannose-6-phosphate isomerase-like protein (cupin superfamily)